MSDNMIVALFAIGCILFGSGIILLGQWLYQRSSNRRWLKEKKRVDELKSKRARLIEIHADLSNYQRHLIKARASGKQVDLTDELQFDSAKMYLALAELPNSPGKTVTHITPEVLLHNISTILARVTTEIKEVDKKIDAIYASWPEKNTS